MVKERDSWCIGGRLWGFEDSSDVGNRVMKGYLEMGLLGRLNCVVCRNGQKRGEDDSDYILLVRLSDLLFRRRD